MRRLFAKRRKKKFGLYKMKNLLLTFLAFAVCSDTSAQTQTVGAFTNTENSYDGYTLYAPIPGFDTYLINNCGEVVNEWTSDYRIGLSAYLIEDGSLLRTGQIPSYADHPFSGGGTGGRVERFSWDGDLIWFIDWADDEHHHHHDIEMLPSGNILLISWEGHSYEEALEMGKNTTQTENPVWCCQIVEIEPTGSEGGNVVWSWSAWDHIVQDTDPAKPNYGVISDFPRKFNINYSNGNGPNQGAVNSDWMHCNSIDYNADLDQIMISSAKFCEFWIIDHSLTTEEAATDAGDLLYRWGNPEAYSRGTSTNQKLYHQHDAHWMDEGVMLYNNGKNRPEGEYSTVEIFELPQMEDGVYPIDSDEPFMPTSNSWQYPQEFDPEFYSQNISGATRLPNGNTLICQGGSGHLFEVMPNEEMVWSYISPITAFGPTTQGSDPGNTSVFRTYRYAFDYPAFVERDMTPGDVIELNSWDWGCTTTGLETSEVFKEISIYPNPSYDLFFFDSKDVGQIDVYNSLGQLVSSSSISQSGKTSFGQKLESGYYIVIFTNSITRAKTASRIVKQ